MAGRRSRRPRAPRDKPPLDAKATKLAAFDLLARKARSVRELTRRLGLRGAPPEIAQAVVADLQSRGYLDDAAFARRWAESRAQGRRIGSFRLRRELTAKGVPQDLIAAAVEAAFEEGSEMDRALETGRKRLPALRRTAPERAPARLAGYLLRRGYPPSTVRQVVRRLCAVEVGEEGESV
ncbi:MAG TPA: regulatory protein RecX [Methylomirabilota bacterium]|jgi:regulatory protein|nr:regulatory protein RecX [Methylomirabilota bacterium]